MPRESNTPKVAIKPYVSRDLYQEIRQLLEDPKAKDPHDGTPRIGYGSLSGLTEYLLRDWVEGQRKQPRERTIPIDAGLYDEIESLLMDSDASRRKWGDVPGLVEYLLRQWEWAERHQRKEG